MCKVGKVLAEHCRCRAQQKAASRGDKLSMEFPSQSLMTLKTMSIMRIRKDIQLKHRIKACLVMKHLHCQTSPKLFAN